MSRNPSLLAERRYDGWEVRVLARPNGVRPELVATAFSRGTRTEAIREARLMVAEAVIRGILALAS